MSEVQVNEAAKVKGTGVLQTCLVIDELEPRSKPLEGEYFGVVTWRSDLEGGEGADEFVKRVDFLDCLIITSALQFFVVLCQCFVPQWAIR